MKTAAVIRCVTVPGNRSPLRQRRYLAKAKSGDYNDCGLPTMPHYVQRSRRACANCKRTEPLERAAGYCARSPANASMSCPAIWACYAARTNESRSCVN
jgi:hypothetical protein